MKPFRPSDLPPKLNWAEIVPLIGKAHAALARYDGLLSSTVNAELFLSPLRTREAVLSSRIEGTQASLSDVLSYEADPNSTPEEKEPDIKEIINYRTALIDATKALKKWPISINLMRDMHKTLMKGVRGQSKAPGEFRRIQNFIGRPGATIESASFVPPEPQTVMPLMGSLEKYIHSDQPDVLVQLALVHAQFEMIHPFLDGNGRVGRLLIPLILFEKGAISSPSFFMSAHLEAHREQYYEGLRAVSAEGDHQGWVIFFLASLQAQAESDTARAMAMLKLYNEMKIKVEELTRSKFAFRTLDSLFSFPLFSGARFARQSGIPKTSAWRILRQLAEGRVLKLESSGRGQSGSVYRFIALSRILGQ